MGTDPKWPAEELAPLLTPRLNEFIAHEPTDKQAAGLLCDHLDVFLGGAGGPGKSEWLLMAALQYVDVPGYKALIIRRTFVDLSMPGALIDRAHEWLDRTAATWDGHYKKWTFPSGAVLQFGYLEKKKDEERYASAEYHFVGFDELTQFTEKQFKFLFSRLRRKEGVKIPVRMRSASNPGGIGHAWVERRYINPKTRLDGVIYIPAVLSDNPHIDRVAYEESLMFLDPVMRARIMRGDWAATESGEMFKREDWPPDKFVDEAPPLKKVVRSWDLAGTIKKRSKKTAGVLIGISPDENWYICDVVKGKWRPGDRDKVIRQTAELDGPRIPIIIEQEGGSGGIAQNEAIIKQLVGFIAKSINVTGDKVARAGALASQANIGRVYLVKGKWNHDFIDEACDFPDGEYLDQIDGASLGFNWINPKSKLIGFKKKATLPPTFRDEMPDSAPKVRDWRDDWPG